MEVAHFGPTSSLSTWWGDGSHRMFCVLCDFKLLESASLGFPEIMQVARCDSQTWNFTTMRVERKETPRDKESLVTSSFMWFLPIMQCVDSESLLVPVLFPRFGGQETCSWTILPFMSLGLIFQEGELDPCFHEWLPWAVYPPVVDLWGNRLAPASFRRLRWRW